MHFKNIENIYSNSEILKILIHFKVIRYMYDQVKFSITLSNGISLNNFIFTFNILKIAILNYMFSMFLTLMTNSVRIKYCLLFNP